MMIHRTIMFALAAVLLLALSGFAIAQGGAPAGADSPAPTADAEAPEAPVLLPGQPGEVASDFTLTDTEGNKHSLSDYLKQDKIVVLEWFNPDCPVVKGYHNSGGKPALKDAYAFAKSSNVAWLSINSGAPGKQGAGLERNIAARTEYGIEYPVLLDEKGQVGRAYGAQTTPHIFVISKDGVIGYNGAPDDSGWTGTESSQNFVIAAITALSQGQPVATAKTEAVGCSVKYAD